MLQIRKMTGADAKTVLPMVYGFYRSDAVDHAVPEETPEPDLSGGSHRWLPTGGIRFGG